jgi:hypothetical protein
MLSLIKEQGTASQALTNPTIFGVTTMNYLNALPANLVTVFNLADRVATVTTAAADRAIAVWSFLTQPQAMHTYRWLGRMTLVLVELIIWSAIWAYAQVAQRFEPKHQFSAYSAKISDAIAEMTDADLDAEFNHAMSDFYDMREAIALAESLGYTNPSAQAQAMTAPIASCRLSSSHPHVAVAIAKDNQMMRLAPSTSHEDGLDRELELQDLTLAQLKPIASALHLATRKVKKAKLIASILEAEGYKI